MPTSERPNAAALIEEARRLAGPPGTIQQTHLARALLPQLADACEEVMRARNTAEGRALRLEDEVAALKAQRDSAQATSERLAEDLRAARGILDQMIAAHEAENAGQLAAAIEAADLAR
jgi:hypothetical protein